MRGQEVNIKAEKRSSPLSTVLLSEDSVTPVERGPGADEPHVGGSLPLPLTVCVTPSLPLSTWARYLPPSSQEG